MGAPGRIVSSLALSAPVGSSLTVAGVEQPWRAGEWVAFDDAFFHSVDNPSPDEYRVVLAVVCWHPDLLARQEASLRWLEERQRWSHGHSGTVTERLDAVADGPKPAERDEL